MSRLDYLTSIQTNIDHWAARIKFRSEQYDRDTWPSNDAIALMANKVSGLLERLGSLRLRWPECAA